MILKIFFMTVLSALFSFSDESRKPNQQVFVSKDLGYHVNGQCDGYPKVTVSTPKGFCVGLLYSGKGLKFPRGILQLASDKILIVDMGGWLPYRGKIHLLEKENAYNWKLKTILKAADLSTDLKKILDRPHFVSYGPNKEVWIGSASTIFTMDPLSSDIKKSIKIKIENLPFQKARHPLKSFTFDNEQNIYVNIGSKSNNCEKFGFPANMTSQSCPEVENKEFGHIRKYKINTDTSVNPDFEVIANGLRNSMSLAWNDQLKLLFQAENSRDAIQKNNPLLDDSLLPHEELNLILKDKNYGWPYCYDDNQISPEFKNANCSQFQKPLILLPAHTAPLGMIFYKGDLFPAWYKNKLLIALHGYREKGHRLIVFDNDKKGLPFGEPLSLIYNWDENDFQKTGSPVGLNTMDDGSLLISEDKSKKILRLYYNRNDGDGKAINEINKPNPQADLDFKKREEKRKLIFEKAIKANPDDLFLKVQSEVLDKHCAFCHGTRSYPAVQFLKYDFQNNKKKLLAKNEDGDSYVIPKAPGKSELILRLLGKNFPQMPPGGFSEEEQKQVLKLVTAWINSL